MRSVNGVPGVTVPRRRARQVRRHVSTSRGPFAHPLCLESAGASSNTGSACRAGQDMRLRAANPSANTMNAPPPNANTQRNPLSFTGGVPVPGTRRLENAYTSTRHEQ